MASLLLASGSARRKELLNQIGVKFDSASMDIDESVLENETPADYVLRLAEEKAIAGLNINPEKVILAADTTVELNGNILGKPEDVNEAFTMLRDLSGSTHQVLTGFAVANKVKGKINIRSQVVTTKVYFIDLPDDVIQQYVDSGEPLDKAGAYGIQGKAALFVKGIEGSYSNVVGLPLTETGEALQAFGIPVWHRT